MKNKIAELMKRPYIRMLIPDPDGGYVGEIKELPGCLTQGETEGETLANLNEAMELWLEAALKQGLTIPEPESERAFSGKLLLRMPKYLHSKLADAADADGVSINQWTVSALAEKIGERYRPMKPAVPTFVENASSIMIGGSKEPAFVQTPGWPEQQTQILQFSTHRKVAE